MEGGEIRSQTAKVLLLKMRPGIVACTESQDKTSRPISWKFTVLVSLAQAHFPKDKIIRETLNTLQIDVMLRAIRSGGQIDARLRNRNGTKKSKPIAANHVTWHEANIDINIFNCIFLTLTSKLADD